MTFLIQIFISITTGYTLAYIFYIIQIHIPKLRSEKTAYEIIKPDLEFLYEMLIEKISIFNKFVIIQSDDKITFPIEEVYFKYLYKGTQRNKNILVTDFLAKAKLEVDKAVDKIISLPVFNSVNFDLIHSLSLLKLNHFWGTFKDFNKFDISFIHMAKFNNITNYFNEVKSIIKNIEKYVTHIPNFEIAIMTDLEKKSHLDTLNEFKSNRVVLRSLAAPHETIIKINKSK